MIPSISGSATIWQHRRDLQSQSIFTKSTLTVEQVGLTHAKLCRGSVIPYGRGLKPQTHKACPAHQGRGCRGLSRILAQSVQMISTTLKPSMRAERLAIGYGVMYVCVVKRVWKVSCKRQRLGACLRVDEGVHVMRGDERKKETKSARQREEAIDRTRMENVGERGRMKHKERKMREQE